VQEENLVLRGRPHRLLLLRDNLLHSTRGGGATTARLPQMLDARARTARQSRPPRTPRGGDRENGVGPSGAGAGRGGPGALCRGWASEGEDIGDPLSDEANSTGGGRRPARRQAVRWGRRAAGGRRVG
jgi:hypothetical protein